MSLRKDPERIRGLFSCIAPVYDKMNRLMSLGLDQNWRRRMTGLLKLEGDERVLDVCCGTGDLTLELAKFLAENGSVIGIDFAPTMLQKAEEKFHRLYPTLNIKYQLADALNLPFEKESFSVVTCAFGVRNLTDIKTGLAEMFRVLKPGGGLACLELSQPEENWFKGLYHIYFDRLIPFVGARVLQKQGPYDYLPVSVWSFPEKAAFVEQIEECGFKNVRFHRLMRGAVAIFLAEKHK